MKKQLHPKLLQTKILSVINDSLSGKILIFKTLILMTGFIVLISFSAQAQTYPKVHQSYRMIEENHKDMVEVSVMVAQCESTGADSIYIMIFNEKPAADTIDFDLTIYKQNNSDSTSKSISYISGIGEMAIPSCGNGSLRSLVFALPSGYDPEKVTFSVKFK